MPDPSVAAHIETVALALRSYFLSPASETQLITPDEVHGAFMGFKISKALSPKGIKNRVSKHFPGERFPS